VNSPDGAAAMPAAALSVASANRSQLPFSVAVAATGAGGAALSNDAMSTSLFASIDSAFATFPAAVGLVASKLEGNVASAPYYRRADENNVLSAPNHLPTVPIDTQSQNSPSRSDSYIPSALRALRGDAVFAAFGQTAFQWLLPPTMAPTPDPYWVNFPLGLWPGSTLPPVAQVLGAPGAYSLVAISLGVVSEPLRLAPAADDVSALLVADYALDGSRCPPPLEGEVGKGATRAVAQLPLIPSAGAGACDASKLDAAGNVKDCSAHGLCVCRVCVCDVSWLGASDCSARTVLEGGAVSKGAVFLNEAYYLKKYGGMPVIDGRAVAEALVAVTDGGIATADTDALRTALGDDGISGGVAHLTPDAADAIVIKGGR
jgi:hypothetical protein